MRRKKKNKKKIFLKILLVIIILLIIAVTVLKIKYNNVKPQISDKENVNLKNYYNEMMITNKDSDIYIKDNEEYKKIGKIYKDTTIKLKQLSAEKGLFFEISDMDDNYYISYNDVDKIDKIKEEDNRYKNYIVFNENITADKINLYKDDKLIYSLNKKISLPIYIKDNNKYYVEYNNQLLNVKKEEVEVIKNNNTDKINTPGIGTLNYHFFYDDTAEKKDYCASEICHSKTQFLQHLDYIKNNNIFTPNMKELEMYIDNKIQLPKSVVITIDDGLLADLGVKLLNEYELNATLFLITSKYDPKKYESKYIEIQSHTDNLHDGGKCPGGQGSGLKCLDEEIILNDFKTSRKKLNDSKVLCYPFYEYNDYTIKLAKEAGFTMAFTGEKTNSDNLVKVNSDKFRLPRFVVVNYTTMNDLIKYIG